MLNHFDIFTRYRRGMFLLKFVIQSGAKIVFTFTPIYFLARNTTVFTEQNNSIEY